MFEITCESYDNLLVFFVLFLNCCSWIYTFRSYMKKHGIKHIRAAPYTPQVGGRFERFHKTLKEFLKAARFEQPSALFSVLLDDVMNRYK